ncbi:hypothetical protein TNCV_4118991 [Trichonephila clavipes]|nr:hypothetical protein TNCV_4118991 [Trichonephila clavipes]
MITSNNYTTLALVFHTVYQDPYQPLWPTALTLELNDVCSNSWDIQIAVPNDPRYCSIRNKSGKRAGQERVKQCGDSLETPLPFEADH